MKRTKSKIAILNCVPVNHCETVAKAFENAGIELYASNGNGHTTFLEDIFCPAMIVQFWMVLFENFQNDVSKVMKQKMMNRELNDPKNSASLS